MRPWTIVGILCACILEGIVGVLVVGAVAAGKRMSAQTRKRRTQHSLCTVSSVNFQIQDLFVSLEALSHNMYGFFAFVCP